jgi:hypothetical protein
MDTSLSFFAVSRTLTKKSQPVGDQGKKPGFLQGSFQEWNLGARVTAKLASEPEQTAVQLTPRQRELASLLAALFVADYRQFPASSDTSPGGTDRER